MYWQHCLFKRVDTEWKFFPSKETNTWYRIRTLSNIFLFYELEISEIIYFAMNGFYWGSETPAHRLNMLAPSVGIAHTCRNSICLSFSNRWDASSDHYYACMHANLCSEFDPISLAFVCVNIILCPSSKTNQCHRSMFRAQILSCTLLSRTKPTLSVLLGYSGNESRLLRYSVRNVGSLFCKRVRLSVVVLSVPSSMSWVSSRLVRYVTA
jgi:hypothetical protein